MSDDNVRIIINRFTRVRDQLAALGISPLSDAGQVAAAMLTVAVQLEGILDAIYEGRAR